MAVQGNWGSRGLTPLGCPSLMGREEVTLTIPLRRGGKDFYRAKKSEPECSGKTVEQKKRQLT